MSVKKNPAYLTRDEVSGMISEQIGALHLHLQRIESTRGDVIQHHEERLQDHEERLQKNKVFLAHQLEFGGNLSRKLDEVREELKADIGDVKADIRDVKADLGNLRLNVEIVINDVRKLEERQIRIEDKLDLVLNRLK